MIVQELAVKCLCHLFQTQVSRPVPWLGFNRNIAASAYSCNVQLQRGSAARSCTAIMLEAVLYKSQSRRKQLWLSGDVTANA